jgi:hypothetical protein
MCNFAPAEGCAAAVTAFCGWLSATFETGLAASDFFTVDTTRPALEPADRSAAPSNRVCSIAKAGVSAISRSGEGRPAPLGDSCVANCRPSGLARSEAFILRPDPLERSGLSGVAAVVAWPSGLVGSCCSGRDGWGRPNSVDVFELSPAADGRFIAAGLGPESSAGTGVNPTMPSIFSSFGIVSAGAMSPGAIFSVTPATPKMRVGGLRLRLSTLPAKR